MARNFTSPHLLGICVLALSLHCVVFADVFQTGEVGGLVVGLSGEPIQGARVYALSTESPNPGRHAEVLTDSKGEFLLKSVREGHNEIHAYAPEIGYPDNLFSLFQTAPVPTVTLKAGATIRGIVVHFGPRPGNLEGEVIDEQTNKLLATASVTLSWVDRPAYYIRSSVEQDGHFTFRIPARPILIVVECSGYRTWKSTITVPSGQTFPLIVSMTK